jgi:hypothetical protein
VTDKPRKIRNSGEMTMRQDSEIGAITIEGARNYEKLMAIYVWTGDLMA